MRPVVWSNFLPDSASVIYSDLLIPDCDRDSLNCEVAQIDLGGGWFIDVEWSEHGGDYIVTLFKNDFDDRFSEFHCENETDVIERVRHLAEIQRAKMLCTSSNYSGVDLETPHTQKVFA